MNTLANNTQALIDSNRTLIEAAKDQLVADGRSIDLNHWLTLKRYAQKYGLESTMVVSNWIARGIVPADNVIQLEELNGLKLIKDMPYKS